MYRCIYGGECDGCGDCFPALVDADDGESPGRERGRRRRKKYGGGRASDGTENGNDPKAGLF